MIKLIQLSNENDADVIGMDQLDVIAVFRVSLQLLMDFNQMKIQIKEEDGYTEAISIGDLTLSSFFETMMVLKYSKQ